MRNFVKVLTGILMMVLFWGFNVSISSAGFLDKLNQATEKLNQASQKMQQKAAQSSSDRNPDGTCKHRSATCMDYGVTMDNCLAPLKGYRAKVTADLIENKLKTEKDLTDQQRKNLEEDLAAFQEAVKNKTDEYTIAGEKNSQRYLMDISQDDQVTINTAFGKKYQEITNKCIGADHMGVGHRTEMNYIQDTSAADAQTAKANAQANAKQECLTQVHGLRWRMMADKMEAKMNSLNPTGQERSDWEFDIAAVREAAEKGGTVAPVGDPKNPTRYMMRLSSDEQLAMSLELSTETSRITNGCLRGTDKIVEREIKKGGLVDKSKSPANKNAEKNVSKNKGKKWVVQQNRGALSCYLGACVLDGMTDLLDCQKQIGGYRWKVLGDKLQAKLDQAKGLSADERSAWEADIAALREADAQLAAQVNPPDPNEPYRYQDRLSKTEQQETNQEYIKMYTAQMKYCNDTFTGMSKHN